MVPLRSYRWTIIYVTPSIDASLKFTMILKKARQSQMKGLGREWKTYPETGVTYPDFTMGKGKSIYSDNVLGNRRGSELGEERL